VARLERWMEAAGAAAPSPVSSLARKRRRELLELVGAAIYSPQPAQEVWGTGRTAVDRRQRRHRGNEGAGGDKHMPKLGARRAPAVVPACREGRRGNYGAESLCGK